MIDKFKNKIRILREEHFPGRSVRSLDQELTPHFGVHFYAYISKVESGILPSIDFVKKIRGAYSLTDDEYEELVSSYLQQRYEDEVLVDAQKSGIQKEPELSLLYRKVNNQKE